MRTPFMTICLVFLTCCIGRVAYSAEGQGPNATVDQHAKPTVTASARAVGLVHTAHSLIIFGRQNKSPLALITAASILKQVQTVPLTVQPTRKTRPNAGQPDVKIANVQVITPAVLLAEARQLAGNDTAMITLADQIDKQIIARGAVPSSEYDTDIVDAYSSNLYLVTFRGRELASVEVMGDASTDLDLYIYDEDEDPIVCDDGLGDWCYVEWVPPSSRDYLIEIQNLGDVGNAYELWTN